MKCPKCIGIGRTLYPPKDGGKAYIGDCDRCHGTGEIEVTNEEYIRSCSTEQLAEFLADQCNEVVEFILNEVDEHAGNIEPDDYWYRQNVFAEWLKKPHKE